MRRLYGPMVLCAVMALSACAPSSLYYWGDYEDSLYKRHTDPDDSDGAEASHVIRVVLEVAGDAFHGINRVQAPFVGANPQHPMIVGDNTAHSGIVVFSQRKTGDSLTHGIKPVQASAVRANPDESRSVHRQGLYPVAAQRRRITGIVLESFEDACFRVETADPTAIGAHPKPAVLVGDYSPDLVAAQGLRVPGFVPEVTEHARPRIQPVQTSARRANPEGSIIAGLNGPHPVMAERIAAGGIMKIGDEVVAVVAVQPLLRPQPDEPVLILRNRLH